MTSSTYHVITLTIPTDIGEITQASLYDHGCLGLEEETRDHKVTLKAYFPATKSLETYLNTFKKAIPNLISLTGATMGFNEADFQAVGFDPFELAPQIWVFPPEDLQKTQPIATAQEALIIRPGMAFGTGRHQTTQLTAEALIALHPRPTSLLDLGTGSGVLAILAKTLKIPTIGAVEVSADARDNAQENFRLNHVETITLYKEMDQVDHTYDVILANILAPTILHLKEKILKRLNTSSTLILSGITEDESSQIQLAFSHLTLIQKTTRDEWCCFTYQKNGL
jgi:ribosomal protein L11 methyltransferase